MSVNSSYECLLSNELQERARKELNEEPESLAQSIEIIREWIRQQPHLNARTDDEFLLRFLRVSKFSLERTKERLDAFYSFRTAMPEWFTNRDPLHPKIQELIDDGLFLILPDHHIDGRRAFLMRIKQWDPKKTDINHFFKLEQMMADILLEDVKAQICGISVIGDMSGLSGAHLSSFSLPIVKEHSTVWQNANPVRIHSINIYNEPSFFTTIHSLFLPLMKDKIKKRLYLHGNNLNSLHKIVPPEMLPVEYGGTAGTVKEMIANFKEEINKRRDQFLEDEKYGVDESKRPGKPKTKEDLFGIDGSFRKLNID